MPNKDRRDLTEIVAGTFDQSKTTEQTIIHWENSWVDERKIPRQDEDDSNPA